MFLRPNIPSWVNPTGVNEKMNITNTTASNVHLQPQQSTNLMNKLPQPIQNFLQMLMGGDLSSLKGFQGLKPVDHDPWNGQPSPFQPQQQIPQQTQPYIPQQTQQISSPQQYIPKTQNINQWGQNDIGLGMYGGQ